MSEAHERRCFDCGNVTQHSSSIVPGVLCKKCGSQDTRRVKEASSPSRNYLNDPKFEKRMILFFYWAMCWHRQSGGYLASDTSLMLMHVTAYIVEMAANHPEMKCFLPEENEGPMSHQAQPVPPSV
jgi:hypothetical protein